tara:strand:- start:162 stop:1919 length:1758 start_codon:yes stop_codon:yes gene_type:complete
MTPAAARRRSGEATDWATYCRLLAYARPYIGRLVTGGLFGILFSGATVGLLHAFRKNLQAFINYDDIDLGRAALYASLLPLLAVVRGIAQYASGYLVKWVGNRVVMDVRVETYAHLQNLSVGYYDSNKTGEMISRTVNDTTLIERAVSTVVTDLVRQPFIAVGALATIVYLDWKLALASLILIPATAYPIAVFGRKVRRAAKQGQERIADMMSIMQEVILGVRVVKAFRMETHEVNRFAVECKALFGRMMRIVRAREMMEPVMVVLSAVVFLLIFIYAGWTQVPFPDLITFGGAMFLMYDPIKRLGKLHMEIQRSSAAADRVFEILDTSGLVQDCPDAVECESPVERIEFKGVSFAYEDTPVLRDISFSVTAGERVAVVGSSGAGKTSLVNLIPRFFDVTAGAVLINGRDLRELTMDSIRRQIGLVTQEIVLFNMTVRENIAYGTEDAAQDALEEAARRAHAAEFIDQLPEKYETVIGERGVRLSGGQRQRLAIARAILNNPPVLILDEATSALDTESERLVQAAIDEIMAGRTVFAIAHRLSTIVNCDRIIVLDAGELVESGTHDELLSVGGIYRRLYDLQFEG